MPNTKITARQAAVELLEQVLGHDRLLSEAMTGDRWTSLPPEIRAAAQRLALDTLRGLERADRILKPFLKKPPPSKVMNTLRLGAVELSTGGAAHGVVNDCVDIVARGMRTRPMKGLVNAVLRNVADKGPTEWPILRVPRLPVWLRAPLIEAWGREAVTAMEAAQFRGAPVDLTAKTDAEAIAKALGGTLLPTGSVRLAGPAQISALPGYDSGDWWVQDAAAALPARLLNARPGETVLDMCAAPGGKTMQLAATGAKVTALDLSASRLTRVEDNLNRAQLTARVIQGDAFDHADGPYDAILLDAPCSATGTIRRHPDLPHARRGEAIGDLIALQAAMLDHALTLLRPGGRLVFCTCSLLPDEGECQIDDALLRHPGLLVAPAQAQGIAPDWRTAEGGIRLRPDYWTDLGGMDGFYMAVLQKPA
ncbi:MAG: methyltransferase domain-containing protein [Rhodobacteraceae bacterium]|nr:methyltransferase domain-containing protein [Paracoccaceae bacterium]